MAQEQPRHPTPPSRPLRVLIAEDNPADAELIVAILKRAGYSLAFDVVDSLAAFQQRLAQAPYDIILSDHNLRTWTGEEALQVLQEAERGVPFVVVTATLGDEAAVEYIKNGATDYVLKHRLERLPVVVGRALREKAQQEEAARLQEQILLGKREWELTFDAVPHPVLLLDADCRIRRANRAAAETLDVELPRLIGQHCYEVIHGASEPPPDCPHYLLQQTGLEQRQDLEVSRLRKVFHFTSTPLRDPRGGLQGCVLVLHDVTQRHRAEEKLRQSEARYRELIENASYGIFRSTPDGRFLDGNQALVEMLGYDSKEDLLAQNLATAVYSDPAECEGITEHVVRTGRIDGVELLWKRKDGKPVVVRLSGRAVRDERGHVEGFEVIAENVTERRALEQQLRQAQKMEAVGRLAGGIAHDFNNLLNVIAGYCELLLSRHPLEDSIRRMLEEINKASDRAAALTRQLLAFSRTQVLEPKVLDLNAVVEEMSRMLQRLIGENIELTTCLEPSLGCVKADLGQFEQVLMNLVVNARDAMPKGGKLTLETRNVDLDEGYARQHADVQPGAYVLLAVSDTGRGMDKNTLSHIFEPFFTTKEKSKGTGLGLATVYGIVRQSGGHIWVYSEPGQGTSFKIYLPRVQEAPEGVKPAATWNLLPQGKETVLVVEDEDGLRRLAREFLETCGYTVLDARDGEAALELARRNAVPIHLLLTDVVLPKMSGRDLARQLAALRPATKVLYMSGYTNNAIVQNGTLELGLSFLQKPFGLRNLAVKVREVLDGR